MTTDWRPPRLQAIAADPVERNRREFPISFIYPQLRETYIIGVTLWIRISRRITKGLKSITNFVSFGCSFYIPKVFEFQLAQDLSPAILIDHLFGMQHKNAIEFDPRR